MTPQELYQIWAPPESIWSGWAKPVLFTQMNINKKKTDDSSFYHSYGSPSSSSSTAPNEIPFTPEQNTELEWLKQHNRDTAIVLDLAGVFAVQVAIELAQYGFRPVPMYNCATSDMYSPTVKVDGIISALATNASYLSTLPIQPDAAPVFMLDNKRNPSMFAPRPMDFDNRWIIFPQDLPSAIFMRSQGIQEVLILQEKASGIGQVVKPRLQGDLFEVVRHWNSGGLTTKISEFAAASGTQQAPAFSPSENLSFGPLSRFRLGTFGMAATLFAVASRRSSGGGFGRIIPDPTTTGGG